MLNDRIKNELTFRFTRSSGPGGQNVNKVNSKAILIWVPEASAAVSEGVKRRFFEKFGSRVTSAGEIQIASDEHRDQSRNKEACVDKLLEMISSVLRAPKTRRKTKPSKSAVERRLQSKKKNSQKKKQRIFND